MTITRSTTAAAIGALLVMGAILVWLALTTAGCGPGKDVRAADTTQTALAVSVDYEVAFVRLEVRREYLRRAASCPAGPSECTARAETETQAALASRIALATTATVEGAESKRLIDQAAACPGQDQACATAALTAAGLASARASTAALQLHLTRRETP